MGSKHIWLQLQKDLKECVARGADIIYGQIGYKMRTPGLENGYWQGPIVLENIEFESEDFLQEFMGPVFCLYRVNSLQEALEYANRSNHGKSATVFS